MDTEKSRMTNWIKEKMLKKRLFFWIALSVIAALLFAPETWLTKKTELIKESEAQCKPVYAGLLFRCCNSGSSGTNCGGGFYISGTTVMTGRVCSLSN